MSAMSKWQIKKWNSIKRKLIAENLCVVDTPSKYIIIGNGGLHNGVSSTKLLELLKTYGEVENFLAPPRKSYAIVSYESIGESAQAVESLQYSSFAKADGRLEATLFLFFAMFDSNITSEKTATQLYPDGLHVQENFITEENEKDLIELVEANIKEQSENSAQASLKHREVIHYGYKFQYGTNDVDLNDPLAKKDMPALVNGAIDQVMATNLWQDRPDQCTVNRYEPGHGIPHHVDNPKAFSSTLSSLSLGSQVLFEMKHENGSIFNILLKPRTLLTLTGESRYNWTHGIRSRKSDVVFDPITKTENILQRGVRWSLTLRKIIDNKSEKENTALPTEINDPVEIERKHVHKVYNNIAQHFASTREKPWPKVVEFLDSLKPHSLVLDVGCGSGKYLKASSKNFVVGCDRSSSLINICQEKHPFVCVADGLNIPVKSDCFDACICIAVVHHYSTLERRSSAIKEIIRVLRPGGLALVHVWAKEQVFKNKSSSYLKQNTTEPSKPTAESADKLTTQLGDKDLSLSVHKNRSNFLEQDMFVPWKLRKQGTTFEEPTHYRFYHVFTEGELGELCNSIENCTIKNSYYDNGNWAIILQKA